MLSSQEQEIWDDIERFWAEEAEEPPLPETIHSAAGSGVARDEPEPPAVIVAGAFSIVLLLLFGEARAALGVAFATALAWTVWHHKQQLAAWWTQTVSPTVAADERRDGA